MPSIESFTRPDGSWISISVAQDASTGAIYVVWTDIDHVTFDYNHTITCFKELQFSAPSNLVTFDYGTYNRMESMEITVGGGVLRMVVSAYYAGYDTWYWDSAITCSAPACGGGGVTPGMRAWAT